MWMRATDRKLFAGLLVALVALAWLALLVWGQSPYDRYLDHGQLSEVTGKDASLLVLFVVGWTVMVFAMMLPTSLPLITLFHTMTRGCPDHTSLVTLLIVGYVSVWMWFGVAVHAGDLALHEGIERVAWLDGNSWVIGAGTLMVAGVYQFARNVAEDGVERLGVLGRRTGASSYPGKECERHLDLPSVHVAHLGGVVQDLVHTHAHEVHEHQLGYGPEGPWRPRRWRCRRRRPRI